MSEEAKKEEGQVIEPGVIESEEIKPEEVVPEFDELGNEIEPEPKEPESKREKRRGSPDPRRANQRLKRELQQSRERMAQLEGAVGAMQVAGQAASAAGKTVEPDLSPDELHELWAEDPIKYNELMETKAYNRIRGDMEYDAEQRAYDNNKAAADRQDQKRLKDVIKRTVEESKAADKLGGEVPDFNELYETGDIQEYMEENPGTDYEVAWERLTYDARVKVKVDAELNKRQKARDGKGNLPKSGSSGGRQPVGAKVDPRVKDPGKFGMSAEDVMTAKLREHRASQE